MKPPEYGDPDFEDRGKVPKFRAGNTKYKFKITVPRDVAEKISGRIFEDVDRGLVEVEIRARSSKYSIEMDIVLILVGGVVERAMELLLRELGRKLKYRSKL